MAGTESVCPPLGGGVAGAFSGVVAGVAAGVEPPDVELPVDEHPKVATSPNRQRTSAVIAANRLMLVILRILSNGYEYSISGNPADTRLPGYVARVWGTAPPIRLPHRPREVNRQRAKMPPRGAPCYAPERRRGARMAYAASSSTVLSP